MALSRKKWNNILIFATASMIAILTLLDDRTAKLPSDAAPLFDDKAPLAQLQLDELWLSKGSQWQCHEDVLNCKTWATAWSEIQLSPVADQQGLAEQDSLDAPINVTILVANNSQGQAWLWYPAHGLLVSPAKNWYQIPPSLREALTPITKISAAPLNDTTSN